ncbi:hypothetical protein ABPG72_015553 [Tetrahymena utriculariae]
MISQIHIFLLFQAFIQVIANTDQTQQTTAAIGVDYLNGQGTFTSTNLALWQVDSPSPDVQFNSVDVNGVYSLQIVKSKGAPLTFLTHHLSYKFTENINPAHLMFNFYSTNVNTEDTNLRLLNSNLNKTVVLFRCGNAGFVRVNDNQMIDFYNSTIEEKQDPTVPSWTRCDIFLDWNSQSLRVYLNQTFKAEVSFYFNDVPNIDTIRVYNLKPSTMGYFQNIMVCASPSCDGFLSSLLIKPVWSCLLIITLLLIF